MMKTLCQLTFLLVLTILIGCEKEPEIIYIEKPVTDSIVEPVAYNISGYVQKGPFANGTLITLYELDSNLNQNSGNNYISNIISDYGDFSFDDGIELSSEYVELIANGNYYNEITGETSSSEITLNGISKITDSTINVNILTHLEKYRIEYLFSQGYTFDDAKVIAEEEIYSIFGMDDEDIIGFENLNVLEGGTNNSILLTISSIIQGYRSAGEMVELASMIGIDITEDGILSPELGAELLNHARYINADIVEAKFVENFPTAAIYDINPILNQFLEIENYEFTDSLISYPEYSEYWRNLLWLGNDTLITLQENTSELEIETNIDYNIPLKLIFTYLEDSVNFQWQYSDWGHGFEYKYNPASPKTLVVEPQNGYDNCHGMIYFSGYGGRYQIDYIENEMLKYTKVINIVFP